MALLVERGANVNFKGPSRYVTAQYAVVEAVVESVMAGTRERVRCLSENGADSKVPGGWGGVSYANVLGVMMRAVRNGE